MECRLVCGLVRNGARPQSSWWVLFPPMVGPNSCAAATLRQSCKTRASLKKADAQTGLQTCIAARYSSNFPQNAPVIAAPDLPGMCVRAMRMMSSQAKPWLRGVVFDLDGTLTAPRQYSAVNSMMWRGAELGLQSDARTVWGTRRK